MKEKIRKIIIEILTWAIILIAIFFMSACAPFGFLFAAIYDVQWLRIIVIFLSAILLLYGLKRYERKN